ncbi:MAG: antitoxin VapB43 [Phycisphaerae bacterium]
MSRTTVRLDENLLAQAKQLAVRTNRTLTVVIEDALREVIARSNDPSPSRHLVFPTYGGGWVRPGVDIDNSAALLEIMEAPDDPA